eukprot:NODE_351_length_8976_cov_1.105666.p1 type:complete len:899 gc:universal NODE_351_length_8976_cov_1.105666:1837-4533(+)
MNLEICRLKGILKKEQLEGHFELDPEYYYRNGLPSNELINSYSGPDILRFIYSQLNGYDYPFIHAKNSEIDFFVQFMNHYQNLPANIENIIELLKFYQLTFQNLWIHFRPSLCIIVKDILLKNCNKNQLLPLMGLKTKDLRKIRPGEHPIDKLFPAESKILDNSHKLDYFSWENITLKLDEANSNTILNNKEIPGKILPYLYSQFAKCYGKALMSISTSHSREFSIEGAPLRFMLKQMTNIDDNISESTVVIEIPVNVSPWKYFWVTWHYNMGICLKSKSKDLPALLSKTVQNDLNVLYTHNKVKFAAEQLSNYCSRIFSTLLTHPVLDCDMAAIHSYLSQGSDILKALVLVGMAAHSKISHHHKTSYSSNHLISYLSQIDPSPILKSGILIAKGLLFMSSPKHVPFQKRPFTKELNSMDYLQECSDLVLNFKFESKVMDLQDVEFSCSNGYTSDLDVLVFSAGVGFGLTTMGILHADYDILSQILKKMIQNIDRISCDKLDFKMQKLHQLPQKYLKIDGKELNEGRTPRPFSSIASSYVALMLSYLDSGNKELAESLNIFKFVETPDQFLQYKRKFSIEDSLYRALLISLIEKVDFDTLVGEIRFAFIPDPYKEILSSNVQIHLYSILVGAFLGHCIHNMGSHKNSILKSFYKIMKSFRALDKINTALMHEICDLAILSICIVFTGSCSKQLGSFIKSRMDLAKCFKRLSILNQSLGLLFLGNGLFGIRDSLVGKAFTLLMVFPQFPSDIEDHTMIFPALKYLWVHVLDSRKFEMKNILTNEQVSVLTKISDSFVGDHSYYISPVTLKNSSGPQKFSIIDPQFEQDNFELYFNEYSSLKAETKTMHNNSIYLFPKITDPLHSVLYFDLEYSFFGNECFVQKTISGRCWYVWQLLSSR